MTETLEQLKIRQYIELKAKLTKGLEPGGDEAEEIRVRHKRELEKAKRNAKRK